MFSLLTLFLTFSENAAAQAYFHFSGNQKKKLLSFKFYRNLIVIPVMLNGKGPFNFVLDTGVGVSTITDPSLKDQLHLEEGRKLMIRGLGENAAIEAYLTSGVTVAAPGIESLPMTLVVFREDPFFLSTYLGIKVHGILGYEFFSSFGVKINYTDKAMTLYTPQKYHPGKNYEAIPMSLKSNKPFIKAAVELDNREKVEVDLLLDTGAGFPLSLESYSDQRLQIPVVHMETQLGLGLNGVIHGSLARTQMLQVGSFVFSRVVTSFPDHDDWETKIEPVKRNGSIGNFLLKRFTVVFDYSNATLYLKPNSRFDAPFEYDRVGIEFAGGGEDYNHYIVYNIKPNSPAAAADIRLDDELLEINFQSIKNLDLGNIDHMLSNPVAKNIVLKIRRGNDYIYVLIKMRDLI